ncbi:MAG: HNH endonuclease [Candidatus Thorarchaeota archaeon]
MMFHTITKKGKQIIENSPIQLLGFTNQEFHDNFGNTTTFYCSIEWGIRSAEILKRDNWTCKFCGNVYANYVHHIRSLKKYPQICLHPDFLITICVSCHEHLHRRG